VSTDLKLYRIDVNVCATAYVKARNPDEAAVRVRTLTGDALLVSGPGIDGRPFEDLLADTDEDTTITLSPHMTIGKPACFLIDLVYDPAAEDETDDVYG